MKRFMAIALAILGFTAVVTLSACNTVEGLGQDVQNGGRSLERAAE